VRRSAAASVLGGLVGGLLGAGVMSAAHTLLARTQPPKPPEQTRAELDQDATVKVGERLSHLVRGRPLANDEKPRAATLVHYGFGAALGAVYGAVAAAAPRAAAGHGAAFGVLAYLGPHATIVPAFGLAPSPLRRPPGTEALELVLHVLYGITVDAVRRRIPWPRTASIA
jgi:uncharacterized membrane protein YagU involved in acid resistance